MKLDGLAEYVFRHLVGTKTADEAELVLNSDLAPAITLLAHGDISGFMLSLPGPLAAELVAYVNKIPVPLVTPATVAISSVDETGR